MTWHPHQRRTYSRFARIRRRLLALRMAPTVEEQLADLRPLASGVVINRPGAGETARATTRTERRP